MARSLFKCPAGTWNIPEHPGTSNNYIIMREICKIKFSKVKLNKNKLVSARRILKKKQSRNRKKKRKMKMTAVSEDSQLRRLIHSFQSFAVSLIT